MIQKNSAPRCEPIHIRPVVTILSSHRFPGQNRGNAMLRKERVIATFCAAGIVMYATAASAQCAARDALNTAPPKAPSVIPSAAVHKAGDVLNIWKTVALGKFANSFALRNALDVAGCGTGDLAEKVLARPAFALASAKTEVDLVVISAAELGLATESVSLREVYNRAESLGLSLAPAEVGPELRLQYLDQPVGEFLHVGMKPIMTWEGDPVIFVVVNGGAGLILIGKNASADAQMPATSTFLFVRPRELQTVTRDHVRAGR